MGLGLAGTGLIRGRVHWARIDSRRTAALVLLGSLIAFGVGGTLSPTPAATPAADTAAAGNPTAADSPSDIPAASPSPIPAAPSPAPPVTRPQPAGRAVTVDGVALPNRSLTPGSVFATATTARICVTGYSSTVRAVSDDLRAAVYARYGLAYPAPAGAYEVDHLVALELGGDNSIANLWPEPQSHGAGYPRKDQLENHLHALVCAGQLPLRTAQLAIAGDWAAAAARYSSVTARPQVVPTARPSTAPPAPAGVYYVNCTAARAAGVTPLHVGDPGYRSGLDRDGDGIACE